MRKKKRKVWGLITLAAVCAASACGGATNGAEEKTELTLSNTQIELTEGESFYLEVSISPDDRRKKDLEWGTNDPSVAVVEGGTVTAKKAGEAIVSVRTKEKSAVCVVKVKGASGSDDSSEESERNS